MGVRLQCTQNAWNQRELVREDVPMVGFFLCLLLASRPAAKAEWVQLSVLKWQVSRVLDIFHDFKDISALLPSHILKLMMTALRVG